MKRIFRTQYAAYIVNQYLSGGLMRSCSVWHDRTFSAGVYGCCWSGSGSGGALMRIQSVSWSTNTPLSKREWLL